MSPEQKDRAYVWDILDAAQRIQEYMRGVSLRSYEEDRKLQLAIERLLEIIGEASRKLSDEFRLENDQIPWTRMVSLRNVLAHEYGEIRLDIIWRVATKRIPELVEAVRHILDQ